MINTIKIKLNLFILKTFIYYFIYFLINNDGRETNLSSTNKNNIKLNISFVNINKNIKDSNSLIKNLNSYTNFTEQKNIIFSDYIYSKNCYDKNAYMLFEYYLDNNIDIPYYIINKHSNFYKSLLKKNKTKNLILFNEKKESNFYKDLYDYLKDTKIIINSYNIIFLQQIVNKVSYIKYLRINHGIKHFKISVTKNEPIKLLGNKTNVICSSPFEYIIFPIYIN